MSLPSSSVVFSYVVVVVVVVLSSGQERQNLTRPFCDPFLSVCTSAALTGGRMRMNVARTIL